MLVVIHPEVGGPDAVSIRAVAGEVGTTTRAVYSLYGSKQSLMDALAARAFDLLRDGVGQLPPHRRRLTTSSRPG
jgi:AcrR family transcriptional regulator